MPRFCHALLFPQCKFRTQRSIITKASTVLRPTSLAARVRCIPSKILNRYFPDWGIRSTQHCSTTPRGFRAGATPRRNICNADAFYFPGQERLRWRLSRLAIMHRGSPSKIQFDRDAVRKYRLAASERTAGEIGQCRFAGRVTRLALSVKASNCFQRPHSSVRATRKP